MSPEKAMRRALSRSADVLWDLVLVTKNVTCDQLDQAGVEGSFNEDELLMLMDGPDGVVGFVSIARDVMTSVIEVQTIGEVTKLPVSDRPLTPTDAAMLAPLIEGSIERLVANLDESPIAETVRGFRFGAMVEDPRAAALLLEAPSYLTFRAEVDLALGRRRGSILFIFPIVELSKEQEAERNADRDNGPFEESLMLVDAKLDTIMCKLSLPLSQLRALQVGEMLQLEPNCHNDVELRSQEGRIVAAGVLGHKNGKRALRLNWPIAPGASEPDVNAGSMMADDGSFEMTSVDEPAFDSGVATDELAAMPELPSLEFEAGDAGVEFGAADAEATPDFDMGSFGDDAAAEPAEGGVEAATSLDDFDFTGDFSLPDLPEET